MKMKKTARIDFGKIIKNAWQLTWYNKYLWWFGLLISLNSVNFTWKNNIQIGKDKHYENFNQFYSDILHSAITFIDKYQKLALLFFLFFLLILFFLWILRVIGKSALIGSIYKLSRGETMNLRKGWQEGMDNWKSLLELELVISLLGLVVAFFLFTPVIWLWVNKKFIIGALLLLVAFFLFLFLVILFGFLSLLASYYVIIGKVGPLESLNLAYGLLRKNWISLLILSAILLAIIFGIAFFVIFPISFFAMLILVVLSVLGAMANEVVSVAMIALIISVLFCCILFFLAGLNVFKYASWYYLFISIAGKRKKEKKIIENLAEGSLPGGEKAPVISKR